MCCVVEQQYWPALSLPHSTVHARCSRAVGDVGEGRELRAVMARGEVSHFVYIWVYGRVTGGLTTATIPSGFVLT